MLHLKINDEAVSIPIEWSEVTVFTYQKLIQCKDIIDQFCALTNISREIISEQVADDVDSTIYEATKFLREPHNYELVEMLDTITLNGVTHKINKNINKFTVAQLFQVRNELQNVESIEVKLARVVSIYLQPVITKSKYDYTKALELEKIIEAQPLYKIYPFGFFIFRKLPMSGRGGLRYLPMMMEMMQKLKVQMLKNYSRFTI